MRTLELSEEQVEEICFQLGTLIANTEDLREMILPCVTEKSLKVYNMYCRELESAEKLRKKLDDWLIKN